MRGLTSLALSVSAVVVSATVGGLFGGQVLARQDSVNQQFDTFASALAAVEANYVDEIETCLL